MSATRAVRTGTPANFLYALFACDAAEVARNMPETGKARAAERGDNMSQPQPGNGVSAPPEIAFAEVVKLIDSARQHAYQAVNLRAGICFVCAR
jgi:hypothetical protein